MTEADIATIVVIGPTDGETEPAIRIYVHEYDEYTIEGWQEFIDAAKRVYWQAKKMRREAQAKARKDAQWGKLLEHDVTIGVVEESDAV